MSSSCHHNNEVKHKIAFISPYNLYLQAIATNASNYNMKIDGPFQSTNVCDAIIMMMMVIWWLIRFKRDRKQKQIKPKYEELS